MKAEKQNSSDRRVSVSTLAQHLDVSRQYLARWLASDGQGRVATEPDGKINIDAARIAYLRWLRASTRQSPRAQAETRYRDLKARHLAIKIAEDEGRLIEVQDSLAVIEGFCGLVLSELSALPARLAGHNLAGRRSVEREVLDLRKRISTALTEKTAGWMTGDE